MALPSAVARIRMFISIANDLNFISKLARNKLKNVNRYAIDIVTMFSLEPSWLKAATKENFLVELLTALYSLDRFLS